MTDDDNTDNTPQTPANAVPIDVRTIFGMAEKQGLVQVTIGTNGIMMGADSAEMLGMFLLKCSEAARGETALYRVMQRRGMSKQQFTVLLKDISAQLDPQVQAQPIGDMEDNEQQPRLIVPPQRLIRN